MLNNAVIPGEDEVTSKCPPFRVHRPPKTIVRPRVIKGIFGNVEPLRFYLVRLDRFTRKIIRIKQMDLDATGFFNISILALDDPKPPHRSDVNADLFLDFPFRGFPDAFPFFDFPTESVPLPHPEAALFVSKQDLVAAAEKYERKHIHAKNTNMRETKKAEDQITSSRMMRPSKPPRRSRFSRMTATSVVRSYP